jgi:hypothetical protein
MTDFAFTPLVNSPHADVISAQLGATVGLFGSVDVGQAVKLGVGSSSYVQCADDDEMEGVVVAVSDFNVNDGMSFGSVQRNKRIKAEVAANEGGTMAVGDHVVIGTPIALGTANGFPQVKIGTAASQLASGTYDYTERTPNTFIWRCIRIISGTGVLGDKVLIEKVGG